MEIVVEKGMFTITGTPAQLITVAADFNILADHMEERSLMPSANTYRDLSDYIIDKVNASGYLSMRTRSELLA